MPERAWAWTKRITWGEGRTVSLDFAMELWKRDVSLYESADGIRDALAQAGKPLDDDKILFEATHSLLLDIVDAAGGVEQAYQRFHQSVEAARETYARWAGQVAPLPEGGGMSDTTIEAAWYALEEALVWARVLDDRLKRSPVDRRQCAADQGLIPALADGPLRDAVIDLRARLLQGGVSEARYLSGLSLHMQSSQAGSKLGRIRSDKLILPFPDRMNTRISHRWQLQYTEGRDAVTFADTLMATVERFMDDMIQAFEKHLPERFRTSSHSPSETA